MLLYDFRAFECYNWHKTYINVKRIILWICLDLGWFKFISKDNVSSRNKKKKFFLFTEKWHVSGETIIAVVIRFKVLQYLQKTSFPEIKV